MAVRSIDSPLNVSDYFATSDDQTTISGADPNGEINMGAFRGLAFALLLQTVLIILGCLGWEIFRAVTR
jgi:hypothetical protein